MVAWDHEVSVSPAPVLCSSPPSLTPPVGAASFCQSFSDPSPAPVHVASAPSSCKEQLSGSTADPCLSGLCSSPSICTNRPRNCFCHGLSPQASTGCCLAALACTAGGEAAVGGCLAQLGCSREVRGTSVGFVIAFSIPAPFCLEQGRAVRPACLRPAPHPGHRMKNTRLTQLVP